MNILIFCSHDAALREYVNVFAKQKRVKPIFCLSYNSCYLDLLDENGNEYVQLASGTNGPINNSAKLVKGFIDNTWLGCALQTFVFYKFLKSRLKRSILAKSKHIGDLIEKKCISMVVVQNDRSVGFDAAAIAAARQKGLKVLLLSFAYSADYKSSYKLRKNKIYGFMHRQPINAVYKDYALGQKSFFRPFESQGLEDLGLLPRNPWVIGGSGFVTVLLDSERELNRIISLGGDTKNYLVTGLASHDEIYDAWLRANSEPREKYIITVALPQYWEHGLANKDLHFEYLNGLLESLSELDAHIVISLHPKMKLVNYEFMASKFGVEITDKPLWKIIHKTNLLVSTYSSTVSWALMCQKKVVIVDHIGLGYEDFYDEFEIPVCATNSEMKAVTEKLLHDKLALDESLVPLIKSLSPFDGKCRQRILDNIR